MISLKFAPPGGLMARRTIQPIQESPMLQYLIDLPQWAHRLIAVLLIVSGAITVAWGSMNLVDSYTSQNWPVATGTVLQSKVTRHHVRRGRFSRGTVYRPEIAYSYCVGGTRIPRATAWHSTQAITRMRPTPTPSRTSTGPRTN